MSNRACQKTVDGSKPPVMRPHWLDPRPDDTPRHECTFPDAEQADIGRRWRCSCDKTWRCCAGVVDPIEWLELPPNPGRPEFGHPDWVAILVSAAVGIGLICIWTLGWMASR